MYIIVDWFDFKFGCRELDSFKFLGIVRFVFIVSCNFVEGVVLYFVFKDVIFVFVVFRLELLVKRIRLDLFIWFFFSECFLGMNGESGFGFIVEIEVSLYKGMLEILFGFLECVVVIVEVLLGGIFWLFNVIVDFVIWCVLSICCFFVFSLEWSGILFGCDIVLGWEIFLVGFLFREMFFLIGFCKELVCLLIVCSCFIFEFFEFMLVFCILIVLWKLCMYRRLFFLEFVVRKEYNSYVSWFLIN